MGTEGDSRTAGGELSTAGDSVQEQTQQDPPEHAVLEDGAKGKGHKLSRNASTGVAQKWQTIKEMEKQRREEVLRQKQSAKARVQELINARGAGQAGGEEEEGGQDETEQQKSGGGGAGRGEEKDAKEASPEGTAGRQMAWALAQLQQEKARRSMKVRKADVGLNGFVSPDGEEVGQEGCETTPKGARQRAWAVAQLQQASGQQNGRKGGEEEGRSSGLEDEKSVERQRALAIARSLEEAARTPVRKMDFSPEGSRAARPVAEARRSHDRTQDAPAETPGSVLQQPGGEGQQAESGATSEASVAGEQQQRKVDRQRALALAKWLEENSKRSKKRSDKPLVRRSTEKVSERAAFFLAKLGPKTSEGQAGSPENANSARLESRATELEAKAPAPEAASAAVPGIGQPEASGIAQTAPGAGLEASQEQTTESSQEKTTETGQEKATESRQKEPAEDGEEAVEEDAAKMHQEKATDPGPGEATERQIARGLSSNSSEASELTDWEFVSRQELSRSASGLAALSGEGSSGAGSTWIVGPSGVGSGQMGSAERRASPQGSLTETELQDVWNEAQQEELQRQVEAAIVAAEEASKKESMSTRFEEEDFALAPLSPLSRFIERTSKAERSSAQKGFREREETAEDDDLGMTELLNSMTAGITSIFSKWKLTPLKSPKKAGGAIPIIDF